MAKSVIVAFIIPVFLLSSCSLNFTSEANNQPEPEERKLLFFSDEQDEYRESVYYDALIDLKRDFPEEIEGLQFIDSSAEENYPFDVEKYPSLVVVDDNQVIFQIEGHVGNKEEIINSVIKALSKSSGQR
ncbi:MULTISPECIES: hypothetical protein [Metabacillus]|uniref:Uncharacterized protein n=1 Tax=Metabacillus hrfriensis TaxID=3048891 RepID=A0ACD4RHI3_9BACI|nr:MULTISPECIES: hypothetical protein [Metabacillus]UAL54074.1 hypothetical protein K8L98_10010 [Metabacillus dongyingensis]UOK59428.1 hypothetical protein MGI18_11635 [Bacillus sp. OVS6]USK30393.1 hypothetical protein LIT32_09910 [Bacillus sp. CMF21]WHZ59642.1 hypothetical protein QLQ22_10040 [Metabacillus sp. CT-WN-B3]